jgi:hypothetical protein
MALQVLRMYRGDDRTWAMTLTGDGDPIDLTDASLRFTAARSEGGTAVIELTSPGDITVVTPAAGTITVTMPAAATSELDIPLTEPWPWYRPWTYIRRRLPALKLFWDIEVTDGAGLKRTWPEDTDGRPRLGILYVSADTSV